MKLKITPGPWATNANISFIYGDINRLNDIMEDLICDPPNCEESYNNWKDNAAAIVTAVNNTYHAGIDPEAVPEMLECLKMSVAIFEAIGIKDTSGIGGKQYNKIKQAIQKATL